VFVGLSKTEDTLAAILSPFPHPPDYDYTDMAFTTAWTNILAAFKLSDLSFYFVRARK
jgi:hypothetical protein